MADTFTEDTLPPFATHSDVPAAVRDALGSTEAELDSALEEATAHIRDVCRWHVAPLLRHVVNVEPMGNLVQLPTLRLVTLHSITGWGGPITYWHRPYGAGRVHVPGAAYGQELAVELTHGYEKVPPALRRLAVLIAARAEASRLGVTREQIGQHSVSFTLTGAQSAGGLVVLDTEQSTLDPYRREATP